MGKRELSESEWDTEVSDLVAFKLDQLQHIKIILFKRISTFLTFILEAPISYYPRERKEGSSRGWKWGKGNSPKVIETQGLMTLGHSNKTICGGFFLSWQVNISALVESFPEIGLVRNIRKTRSLSPSTHGRYNGIMIFKYRVPQRGMSWGFENWAWICTFSNRHP